MPFVLGLCDPVLVLARGTCDRRGHARTRSSSDPRVLDAYLGDDFVLEERRRSMALMLPRSARRDRRATAAATCCRASTSRSREGSIACIVGPNGAGKSTVLRAVSGLLAPREGEIELDGRARSPGCRRRRSSSRGIAQVPQSNALFPNITVRENVLMGAYIIRRDRALVKRRYAEVEELFPVVARARRREGGQPLRRPAPDGRVRPLADARPEARAARRAVARASTRRRCKHGLRERRSLMRDARQDDPARRAERPLRPAAGDARHRDGERPRAADRAGARRPRQPARWPTCTSAARSRRRSRTTRPRRTPSPRVRERRGGRGGVGHRVRALPDAQLRARSAGWTRSPRRSCRSRSRRPRCSWRASSSERPRRASTARRRRRSPYFAARGRPALRRRLDAPEHQPEADRRGAHEPAADDRRRCSASRSPRSPSASCPTAVELPAIALMVLGGVRRRLARRGRAPARLARRAARARRARCAGRSARC